MSHEYGIASFDGDAEILRRRSWDAKASAEEKAATDALMKRIHQLQNTRGKELLGVQITAYFLRIWVQPLQARKNPLWSYAGEEDVDRLSADLSTKDLEKLIRRFSSLSKKDEVPTSCRVEPYSCSHALPEVSIFSFELYFGLSTDSSFFLCIYLQLSFAEPPNHIFSSPFLRMERWMSESLLLTTRKNLLTSRVKSPH
jgi:hypothetical protein